MTSENRRLLWRCRRGVRELDLVLESYCRDGITRWTPAERDAFETLLEVPDPLLIDWILGGFEPPAAFRTHVRQMRRESPD